MSNGNSDVDSSSDNEMTPKTKSRALSLAIQSAGLDTEDSEDSVSQDQVLIKYS